MKVYITGRMYIPVIVLWRTHMYTFFAYNNHTPLFAISVVSGRKRTENVKQQTELGESAGAATSTLATRLYKLLPPWQVQQKKFFEP